MFAVTYNVSRIIGIIALGGFVLGMDVSSMSIFIGSEHFNQYFNFPGPFMQGLMTGANPVGGLIGCILFGIVSERVSRVGDFQLFSSLWIMGSIVSALVLNAWMVVAGRLIRGISVGAFSVLLPLYIGEVITSDRKGAATSIVQLSLTAAILVMFYVCFFLNFLNNDLSFRLAWGIEIVPALALLLSSYVLPESPKWLVARGEYAKAQEILGHLSASSHGDTGNDSFSKIELLEKYGSLKKISYLTLFSKNLRVHTLIGMTIQIMVQTCGINVLMFYVVYICEMIGFEGNLKMMSASVPYIINVVFTLIPIHTLDKLRRKEVLVYGAFFLSITMTLIGTVMGAYGHEVPPMNGNKAIVWEIKGKPGLVVLGLCFLFVAVFASTLSCCAWLYTNEILPARAKSKGMSLCMATSWCLNSVLAFLTPTLLSRIKWATFILLGGVTFVIVSLVSYAFPETYGLSETEVENLFLADMGLKSDNTDEEKSENWSERPRSPAPSSDYGSNNTKVAAPVDLKVEESAFAIGYEGTTCKQKEGRKFDIK